MSSSTIPATELYRVIVVGELNDVYARLAELGYFGALSDVSHSRVSRPIGDCEERTHGSVRMAREDVAAWLAASDAYARGDLCCWINEDATELCGIPVRYV